MPASCRELLGAPLPLLPRRVALLVHPQMLCGGQHGAPDAEPARPGVGPRNVFHQPDAQHGPA
eukprot:13568097-Alexandrium_andersonii.AAC.1